MIGWRGWLRVMALPPGCRCRRVYEGPNAITTAGQNGLAARLLGDTDHLGASRLYAGSTELAATQATGYPQRVTATDALLHRWEWTTSSSFTTISNPTFGLRPTASASDWFTVAGSSLAPALTSLAANTRYEVEWTLTPQVSFSEGGDTLSALLGILGETATGALGPLTDRVGNLQSQAAIATATIQLIGLISTTPADRLTDPVQSDLQTLSPTIGPITVAAKSGEPDVMRVGSYTFPTVTGSGYQLLRWYGLTLNPGGILVDAARVTADGVQQFTARATSTPDLYLDIAVG